MMACTPSSLRRSSVGSGEGEVVVSAPEVAVADLRKSTNEVSTLPELMTAVAQQQEVPADSMMAAARDSLASVVEGRRTAVAAGDSLSPQRDSLAADGPLEPSAIRQKRDTTQMDSLELFIYKHNKAVDDSLRRDSINRTKKNGIDAPVNYSAEDSLTYEAGTGVAHLYGQSKVKYINMDLAAEKIFMSLDSNLVHATGKRDSATDKLVSTPVFKMGSDEYQSDTMSFNFKTKKGLITEVYTQQQDGFLRSEKSKRGATGEMYLEHGRYTTCDQAHPDFYIAMSRAKVRPGKDVVFGPAYLVVADVPLPLAIPYGFFPFSKSYSSGFIMPTYGDETDRGFYLRDGGYYFAISDKMDLKVLGEIYTKGSWGISVASNYRKRYKYSGSIYASYLNSVSGDKNMPDYTKTVSFKLQWSHRQDSKANPFSSLNANVNFASTSYERNNLTSMYNPQAMTQSTRTSSVSWSTTFSSIGMTLSSTMNLNQNMRDSTIDLKLPDLDISISRFYPFKRKKAAGEERWYEKINMSYTGHFTNSINTKESKLLHSNFARDWQNGMLHTIRTQGNFTFGNFNVTPSFNLTDRTYFSKQKKSWDTATQKEVTDTITGFYNVYNWDLSLNMSTKLYGFWVPSRKLFGDKIQAIRHVLTPQVSLSYAPDFGDYRYGYYTTYQKTDADGNVSLVEYSPYYGVNSPPSKGMRGSVNFDLSNNLEMKVKSDDDSTGFKKISLIDELGFSMSYNMAASIRPLSDLSMRLRLKLTKSYTFNLNAVFASYVYEADSVGATPRLSEHTTYWGMGKLGRFQGMSQNISRTIDNKKVANFFKWLRGEKVDKDEKDKKNRKGRGSDDEWDTGVESNVDNEMEQAKRGPRGGGNEKAETDDDGYMAFSIPWSITIGYGITMREGSDVKRFNYNTMRYPYEFTHNLNFSGYIRLAEGWNINFSSGWDFNTHQLSMTTASLSRDLHCFNMSCSVVLAPHPSYNFSFRCNAATLTDALKYDKRSSYSNAVQWY